MSNMPLSPTSNDHFPLNWGLTALTSRTEEFMIVEMAVEAETLIAIIFGRTRHIIIPRHTIANAIHAIKSVALRLRIEGNTLEAFTAVVATETLWMEAYTCCGDDAACDRESTRAALSADAARACETCRRDMGVAHLCASRWSSSCMPRTWPSF
jgi:hypothetical protein